MMRVTFTREQQRAWEGALRALQEEVPKVTTGRVLGPVLRRAARPALDYLRSRTPLSTLALRTRLHLADSPRTRIKTYRRDGRIVAYVKWQRGRRTGIRWQQALAVEYGARGRPGQRITARAGAAAVSRASADAFMAAVYRRIEDVLSREKRKMDRANARARRNR